MLQIMSRGLRLQLLAILLLALPCASRTGAKHLGLFRITGSILGTSKGG